MNFLIRTITAIVYACLIIGSMLGGPVWFCCLMALVAGMTANELIRIVNNGKGVCASPFWASLCSICLVLSVFAAFIGTSKVLTLAAGSLFLLSLIVLLIRELFLRKESPILNIAVCLMAILYVGLPCSLFSAIAYAPVSNAHEYSWALPLAVFIFIWLNDVGAYCVGCTMGKHKLFERVSPKKTWEGSIGGAVFAIGGALLFGLVFDSLFGMLNALQWIGMALVVVVVGTLGDLVESLMKRELGIKDSGKILPGHGGMLDRFDSTLMAVPAVTVYLYLILLL